MSNPLVSDALWSLIAPLLPPEPPKPRGGRPRSIPDRAALTGILFVLKSGIGWEMLPQEMGCGSGMDLLATAAGLAASRSMDERAPCPVATVARCWADRVGMGRT